MFNVRLAGDHLYGKLLFTWLSLVMSMMMTFCAVLFPTRCLGWDLELNWVSFWGFSFLLFSILIVFYIPISLMIVRFLCVHYEEIYSRFRQYEFLLRMYHKLWSMYDWVLKLHLWCTNKIADSYFFFFSDWRVLLALCPFYESWGITICTRCLKKSMSLDFDI